MSNEDGVVTTEREGHVFVMTVDRADKMNGFTPSLFDQLADAMGELDNDPELWVGVIAFAGEHTTAGLDMPKFFGPNAESRTSGEDQIDAFAMRRRCTKPVVMAVQGVTFTIGIEMMLGVDIVIAAENCRFRQLEPKRGLAVFGGAHVRYVQRAGWGNAMYHLLRADEFDAARALELGFVQEVVPVGDQVDRARTIASEIAECAPLAVQEIKRAAFVYLQKGERAAFDEIPAMRERTLGSADAKEGMQSFIEKRDAQFTGE
ncbi:MAG: crotonase/enoyl-CoA hydratase family protein [Pseudomonadales bacterium]|nr:crotonase/enoyl-CoA hydratase family protein [Pseudomonadales bacterium]